MPELTSETYLSKFFDLSLEVPYTLKRPLKSIEKDTTHNFTFFQNIFIKELEAIKYLIKSVERKFEELKKAGLLEPKVSNCNGSSSLTAELLKHLY